MIRFKSIIGMLLCCGMALAQPVGWEVNSSDYQYNMRVILKAFDQCTATSDADDWVAAVDIHGVIRGIEQMNGADYKSFLTIYSNSPSGDKIYFRFFDASSNTVYNILNKQIVFSSTSPIPTGDPDSLFFNSVPTTDAGPDQIWYGRTTAELSAVGIGKWTIIRGVGGSFVNMNDPNTTFMGQIGEEYLLVWTETSIGQKCEEQSQSMRIELRPVEPENNVTACTDGHDNDNDGLTDCADSDCGQPSISSVAITNPTPINCSSTQANGIITIAQIRGDSFSIDLGASFQSSNIFSNLVAGRYIVMAKNSATGCQVERTAVLDNLSDPIASIAEMNISGPKMLCQGLKDVRYDIDIPNLGVMTWEYTGSNVSVKSNGSRGTADFGVNATTGGIVAKMSSACSSISDTLMISFASPFICGFSNCPLTVNISTDLLESLNAPQVYRAQSSLTSNAEVKNFDYEFSAGDSIVLTSGFSVTAGVMFEASINHSCPK
jgi:hypothetical protein